MVLLSSQPDQRVQEVLSSQWTRNQEVEERSVLPVPHSDFCSHSCYSVFCQFNNFGGSYALRTIASMGAQNWGLTQPSTHFRCHWNDRPVRRVDPNWPVCLILVVKENRIANYGNMGEERENLEIPRVALTSAVSSSRRQWKNSAASYQELISLKLNTWATHQAAQQRTG